MWIANICTHVQTYVYVCSYSQVRSKDKIAITLEWGQLYRQRFKLQKTSWSGSSWHGSIHSWQPKCQNEYFSSLHVWACHLFRYSNSQLLTTYIPIYLLAVGSPLRSKVLVQTNCLTCISAQDCLACTISYIRMCKNTKSLLCVSPGVSP